MARLTRAAIAAAAMIGLCATALAIGAAERASRDPERILLEQNEAAKARMDAFDLRLKIAADRIVASICSGCLPGTEVAPALRRVRVARRRTNGRRFAAARAHRPLRLTVRPATRPSLTGRAPPRVRETSSLPVE